MTALTEVGEEGLRKMLEVSTDFIERRQIRAALRQLQFGCIPGLLVEHNNNSNNHIEKKMADTELDKKLCKITDEDEMTKLLHATDDFEDRRKIRAALRDLKKKKLADQEAANAAARKNRMTEPKRAELNLDGTEDENVLRQMLEETEDYEHKKQLRAAIKDLRQKARDAAEEVIDKEEKDYRKIKHLGENEDQIPAVSVSTADAGNTVVDITTIDDIATLERMLATTEDFGERSMIRSHIKELRDKEDLELPNYPGARRLSEGLDAAIWLTEKDRRRSSLIDRAALEELTLTPDVEENVSYDEIEDPEELERMLENAVDIGEKRLIRGALKDLRQRLAGGVKKDDSTSTDVSFCKPEVRISPSEEEPKKTNLDFEVKTRSKLDCSSNSKTESLSVKEKFETSKKLDSNKACLSFPNEDVPGKRNEKPLFKEETENKENKRTPVKSTTWFSGVPQTPEIITPSKSSSTSLHAPKEKNNNDISIKPLSKLSVPHDSSKTKPDTSIVATPSKIDSTHKENERNKTDSALAARMSKFTTPTTDLAKSKAGDRSTPSPSTSRLDKNGKAAKDLSSMTSRMSKFNTPLTETTKGKVPGLATPSGSKLDQLKSKFSESPTSSQKEIKVRDRALRGTQGKVSEAASKFGGSCSGSSCGTTPSHSPTGSAPSSPKRSVGQKAFVTPVSQKPFQFGKIHNPSLAATPSTSKVTTKSSSKSENVPLKPATLTFETPTSSSSKSVSSPYGTKGLKSTRVEVPLGKAFSLELETPRDSDNKVESSSKSRAGFGASSRSDQRSGDRTSPNSVTDKTEQRRKKSPTERKAEGKIRMPPVDDIEDEEALEKMLEAASEFEERKKIRAKLREIRKKKREEQDKQIAAQQKAMQDDILTYREESKAHRLKAFDKSTPIKKDITTTVAKTPLNNNTIIAPASSTPLKSSTNKVEDTDGKTSTSKTTTVIEGPGAKMVTTTIHSKSEDKGTKSESMKQETAAVKREETGTSSTFSAKSSSVSSSVTTSSSTGTPAKKMSKFEAEMEEKKKLREQKRAEEEKNWKEYMAKKKQDDYERKKKDMEAAKKKKDALMNKFGGKAQEGESGGFGRGTGMQAVPNANTIKQKLLEWCQRCARGYPEVQITNFSSCWADGMAFCAIVHYHFPNAFDFDALDKKNRRKNFDLAFDSAEKLADIMPLLETDDMIMMKNKPDWKCVFTYVQSLYRHLIKIKP